MARRYACVFLTIFVFAAGGPAFTAGDWYVASTGNDGNDCQSFATPCQTIQAAINKASNGDTIYVAAGLYPEPAGGPLTVNKTLTLLGEQEGNDARTRAGAESVIADPQGTSISASGVVIDGFTVQDSALVAFTGFGLWMNAGISGTQILNNIIQNNIVGIGLCNTGTQAVIRHNLIRTNNRPGGASGTGIYTDQFVCSSIADNVLIDENDFRGNNVDGIDVSNTASAPVTDLEISNNLFDMNGRAVVLFNTDMSSIHDNVIRNSTFAASAAIRLFDSVNDLTIENNDILVGSGHGIRISDIGAVVSAASSGIEIHQNNFEFLGLTGLTVDPLSHDGTVDAECNWWNSSTGPTSVDNPGGTGEEVVGDADFTPWLLAPAPGGPCFGGVPSTPGKVTGGGQIGSDPIFSPLGDLISVPAVIPSAANPQSQATFGFVARCCAAQGNLSYHDHQTDVRIKAVSIDGLFISSPGTSCPAVPGSSHATFFGTATVTRPIGTTTESFTVDVDDCGEPGTADTFGIKTTSYANGPSPLIGGNIQIHR